MAHRLSRLEAVVFAAHLLPQRYYFIKFQLDKSSQLQSSLIIATMILIDGI